MSEPLNLDALKPITGDVSVTAPMIRMLPAGPPHTYVAVAYGLLHGVKALAATDPMPAMALALLCAHSLECALKAYLTRDGDDRHVRDAKIRHNLNGLWALAVSEGLEIDATPPFWADRLSGLHDAPFALRYLEGERGDDGKRTYFHGLGLVPAEPTVAELEAVLGAVERACRGCYPGA